MSLHRLVPGIETPYVMGSPNVISEYPDCKDYFVSAFGSVRARNRLVWIVCLTLQVGSQVTAFHLHEDGLRIDETALVEIEVDSSTQEFF